MKAISIEEQKLIMLDMLKYFDDKCRLNNINYSLIGGSLIGAIRHKGFIPWDDDIDVILSKDNYDKIIKILKNDNCDKYFLLDNNYNNDYFLPFPKLINRYTYVVEPGSLVNLNEYGIFIDILCYNYLPDGSIKNRARVIKKIKFYNGLLSKKSFSNQTSLCKRIMNKVRNTVSTAIGNKFLLNRLNIISNRYSCGKYVISNWPIYPINKEIQLSDNIKEYIDVPFENITSMIFKEYDAILKTTFGNYMVLPPEEKRICHGLLAYWREDNE